MTTAQQRSAGGFENALDDYRETFMASRNFADETRRAYHRDLADLVSFLTRKCFLRNPVQVEKKHLEAYLAELDRHGFMGNTRRRRVASIKSFFAFLEDHGVIPVSPALRVTPPEREHIQPRVLTEAEYKRLQLACAHEVRDGAVIELLLQTGMRLSEVSRISVRDIELPAKITKDEDNVGSVHILGKGRKDRTVTLNWKACKALKAYLRIRPAVEHQRVFVTKFGTGMGPRAIEQMVAKYLKEADIRGASVHSLRHTFATHMVKRGTKLDVVRQALGHASLKTTSIYVTLARDVMDRELQANAL